MEWITPILAIFGAVSGATGTYLGIQSYRRDKAKVEVFLQWDMSTDPPQDNDEKVGVLRISNIGRRPVYLSHAHLRASRQQNPLILAETIAGFKIGEADPPKIIAVPQKGLLQFSQNWEQVEVVITDTAGNNYVSNRTSEKPSWAIT